MNYQRLLGDQKLLHERECDFQRPRGRCFGSCWCTLWAGKEFEGTRDKLRGWVKSRFPSLMLPSFFYLCFPPRIWSPASRSSEASAEGMKMRDWMTAGKHGVVEISRISCNPVLLPYDAGGTWRLQCSVTKSSRCARVRINTSRAETS